MRVEPRLEESIFLEFQALFELLQFSAFLW